MGAMFRRERPQKGRYRQFHQIGVEAFGIAEPAIDAEQIAMVEDWLSRLGVTAALQLNSVGDPQCRPAYLADLRACLTDRAGELCGDCRERTEKNPLRVLDCKVPTCQPVLRAAPRLLDQLCEPCRDHFDAVRAGLDALGVAYTVEPRLVRGLDYYVRTAYEFTSDALGAQSAVAGGGRYDGLVETLGGPPTPGVGFALGVERLALILEALGRPIPVAPPGGLPGLGRRRGGGRRVADLLRAAQGRAWPATSMPAAASWRASSSRPSGSRPASPWCWAARSWRPARAS